MTPRSCCSRNPCLSGHPPAARRRRTRAWAAWLLPGVVLTLLPKCPACLAAYVALATGLGISLQAATCLRASLILVSVAALIASAIRYCQRRSQSHRTRNILASSRSHALR